MVDLDVMEHFVHALQDGLLKAQLPQIVHVILLMATTKTLLDRVP